MAYQKITDIYTTAIDYSPKSEVASKFFSTVQNKLHFAITGHTAAEIIKDRANHKKPNMGLTTWRKSPDGKILPTDVIVAKIIFQRRTFQAQSHCEYVYRLCRISGGTKKNNDHENWSEKLDGFLKFNEQDVLDGFGKITAEIAKALAEEEYTKYRVIQDQSYVSDFDKLVEASKIISNKPKTSKDKLS